MAEEQKVTTIEPQQITKKPQQVTTKNPKKAEDGKRFAAHNRRQREKKREKAQVQKNEVSQYYGIGAVIALGVIGGLGYYIYQTKKGRATGASTSREVNMPHNPTVSQQPRSQTNKFEME